MHYRKVTAPNIVLYSNCPLPLYIVHQRPYDYPPPSPLPQYNLVGRLLGPKGMTLKKMQAETTSRMSILGRGSMRQKSEEEKQRSSGLPGTVHLNEHLHVLVEVMPPHADVKLSAAVADVKKMLVPPVSGWMGVSWRLSLSCVCEGCL